MPEPGAWTAAEKLSSTGGIEFSRLPPEFHFATLCASLCPKMTETLEHLLNEHEAASRLGLAVATLRRWRWSGHGPRFAKIGRAVRYDPVELRAYIDAQTRRSTSDVGMTP